MDKFKIGAWLFFASLFILGGIVFWGVSVNELPDSRGKGGVMYLR